MPMELTDLLSLPPRDTIARHSFRDIILYALGCGASVDDPLSAETLRYTYEEGLAVLPTMAAVLATPGFWMKEPQFGLDWRKVLHAEQSVTLHRPIPIEGELLGRLTVEDIFDKGAAKGAIIYSKREIYDNASGDHIATDRRSTFLRGDGGRGGKTEGQPVPHPIPDRACDASVTLQTSANQALIYRLSGDYNPLHVDPAIAVGAGFERPILHGLSTYGVVGRALLRGLCDGDASRLTRMDCRFSAPVYPGETIRTDIWHEGAGRAAFRSSVVERALTVLDRGYVEYR